MCMFFINHLWKLDETQLVDRAKTRIQAFPSDAKGKDKDGLSMIGVLLRIYKKEGILGLYRGFGATMLNTFSMRELTLATL
jgi:adenine nucleotide transporter 17